MYCANEIKFKLNKTALTTFLVANIHAFATDNVMFTFLRSVLAIENFFGGGGELEMLL